MKRLTLEQKALRVIEMVVSDALSQDVEFNLLVHNKAPNERESRLLVEKLIKIYEIAHSAIKDHSCYYVHTNWRNRTLKMFKGMLKESIR